MNKYYLMNIGGVLGTIVYAFLLHLGVPLNVPILGILFLISAFYALCGSFPVAQTRLVRISFLFFILQEVITIYLVFSNFDAIFMLWMPWAILSVFNLVILMFVVLRWLFEKIAESARVQKN